MYHLCAPRAKNFLCVYVFLFYITFFIYQIEFEMVLNAYISVLILLIYVVIKKCSANADGVAGCTGRV